MYEILFSVAYVLIAFVTFFLAIYFDRKKYQRHGVEHMENMDDELVFVLSIFWPVVLATVAFITPFMFLKRLAINMATPRKNYINDCSKEYES